MLKTYFSKLVNVGLIFTLLLAFALPSMNVSAEQTGNLKGPANYYQEMTDEFNQSTTPVDKQEKKDIIKLTKNNIINETINLKSLSHSELNFNDAIVHTLENGDYFVKVSAKGDNAFKQLNGFSVVYDQNKKLLSIYEVNLNQLNGEEVALKTWSNGQSINDVVMVKPDVQPQWSFSYFNDCLSSQGVSWAVVAALGFMCGAACVGTAGAACAPCLYAGSAISGGTIGYCLGNALKH